MIVLNIKEKLPFAGIYKEYLAYRIYTNGKIYSTKKHKFINQHNDGNGYLIVKIRINNKSKNIKVHRLVAQSFIENPENKPQVNHIDGNKTNNDLSNLEWVTRSENIKHAFKIGLKKPINKRLIIDTNTGIFYDSIKEASKAKNISYISLRGYLTGVCINKTTLIYT